MLPWDLGSLERDAQFGAVQVVKMGEESVCW